MIKYNTPISVSKKFQYGGTVTMGADYAPGRLEWLSRAGEGFKDWNRASAASTGKVVSKAIPKVTPIDRTVSKVAGPIGIASMILTPAQANVGEDELFRNPSSPFYRGRFLTESSDGQASEEQANESAATKEGVAAGTVSNPQEDPNKKKDKKKEEKKETKANTFTRKITNGTNSIDQFWGNRLNWWETSKNSTATPFVRGLHNFITRPIVAYEFVREGIPGGIELAKEIGANIVLATDPDADRLGIAVLHAGKYHLFTGNQTAALVLEYILETRKEKGTLPSDGYVFTTNVSSSLPVVIAKHYGMNVEITLTGFKYIGEKALEMEKGRGTYVFGFEESYGCLVSPIVRDKDSIQAILMLCECAAYYRKRNMDLYEALEEVYAKYGYYKEDITNIALKGLDGSKKIQRIMDYFRNNDIKLNDFNILVKDDIKLGVKKDLKTNETTKIDLPTSNVIKYYLNDDMWFVLRPSGTEPKLKVYYGVKGKNEENANSLLAKLKEEVLAIVNTIEQ